MPAVIGIIIMNRPPLHSISSRSCVLPVMQDSASKCRATLSLVITAQPAGIPMAEAAVVMRSPKLLLSAITTLPVPVGRQLVIGTNTATVVERWWITAQLMAPTVMALGNTTLLLSIDVSIPVTTVDRVRIPTRITPPPQVIANTALLSIRLVPTAPPALPMSAQPPRKATALPTEAGRTMTELSTAEPRPAPLAITAPTSTQTTL